MQTSVRPRLASTARAASVAYSVGGSPNPTENTRSPRHTRPPAINPVLLYTPLRISQAAPGVPPTTPSTTAPTTLPATTAVASTTPPWIKDKIWTTQEVVIGGWRQGEGGRSSGIGALMLGIPEGGGLHFAGRVGTGFTEKELTKLKGILEPLHTDESPFNTRLPTQDAKA
jgi:ATP dependent DNA ligase C terminal region